MVKRTKATWQAKRLARKKIVITGKVRYYDCDRKTMEKRVRFEGGKVVATVTPAVD